MSEVTLRLHDLITKTHATVDVVGQLPQVIGHAGWLEEVWVNYVTNALKYGGNPPQVILGATTQGDYVRFWVQDDGPGIALAEQQRLFEPFVRLHPHSADGHGLGLSIVRRIVQRCNGQVGVVSRPGEGSTFWFELPIYKGSVSVATTKPIAINARMNPR